MSISDWSNYEGPPQSVKWSKDDMLEYLDQTENVSETSGKGLTFMHVAAAKGWQEVLEKFNELVPTMKDAQSDLGATPFQKAAREKKTGTCKWLLTAGADPTITCDAGWNSLHSAAFHGLLQGIKS